MNRVVSVIDFMGIKYKNHKIYVSRLLFLRILKEIQILYGAKT